LKGIIGINEEIMTEKQFNEAQKVKQGDFIKENNLVEVGHMDLREGNYFYFLPFWDKPRLVRISKLYAEHPETWGKITNMQVHSGKKGAFPIHIFQCIEEEGKFFSERQV
jgi:hypothetical protein